jgi:hypothetical protein
LCRGRHPASQVCFEAPLVDITFAVPLAHGFEDDKFVREEDF